MSKFNSIIPVILSGGSGTRLWPVSRKLYPKQFIPLHGNRSLFQDTLMRTCSLAQDIQVPIVVCNEEHRFMAAEQIRLEGLRSANIILEPVGRNTAPAIGLAALCAQQRDPEATILVLPADHIMQSNDEFHQAIECALGLAENNHLVTFGIKPHAPETGYGYIKAGETLVADKAFRVQQFSEKPALEKAEEYVKSGQYSWNSGMFMFKASVLLEQLELFEPEMIAYLRAAFQQQDNDLDFIRVGREDFEQCNNQSIDYALMEKTQNAAVIPLSCGWNDVGSWHALWESSSQDEKQNAIDGDVLIEDCEGCMVRSSHRLISAIGLKDMVIVETADAVMIAPRSESQNVKHLTQKLKHEQRPELDTHLKVYRPWGDYESIDSSERFQVKRITVKSGEKLSLQKHHHRAEHWIVVNGTARVTCGDKQFLLSENESTYIPIGEIHRLENPGKIPLELIEVQSGTYLGEDDIERFDDKYGR